VDDARDEDLKRRYLQHLNNVIKGDLLERGNWVVANIDTSVAWPTTVIHISFRDHTLFLIPGNPDFYPAVALRLSDGEKYHQGQTIIMHFLSTLAWVERRGIAPILWGGGSLPAPYGRGPVGSVVTHEFYVDYLPDPTAQTVRWALAFFREGLSLNHAAYQFLSFYKIINMIHRKGKDQVRWMNDALGQLDSWEAKKRLAELRAKCTDIGGYLYKSGRNAVAHAGASPTVDPENLEEMRRLLSDLPVIRELAAYAIEHEFGVKSHLPVWREHLYELDGFRKLFGDELVQRLKNREGVRPGDLPRIPLLSIGLDHELFFALQNLSVEVAEIRDGEIALLCTSNKGHVKLALHLNFPDECMNLNSESEVIIHDDGSAGAAEMAKSVTEFRRAYFRNGRLQVWNAETKQLMGRCDPFVPTNVDMGATDENFREMIRILAAEGAIRGMYEGTSDPKEEFPVTYKWGTVWRVRVRTACVTVRLEPGPPGDPQRGARPSVWDN
jgi:hypothetical protein